MARKLMKPKTGLGRLIRAARQRKGLSREEAAQAAGLNPQTWRQVENGAHSNLSRKYVLSMARVLGINPLDILLGKPGHTKVKRHRKRFGTVLREAREALGLSQRQLPQRVGISYTQLRKFESGEHDNPTGKTLLRLAKGLHIDPVNLL